MRPMPTGSAWVAPVPMTAGSVTSVMRTKNCSLSSSVVSLRTVTVTVALGLVEVRVTVPLSAV